MDPYLAGLTTVSALWLLTVVVAGYLVHRRIAKLERLYGADRVAMFGNIVPLGYAVGVAFWPLGPFIGLWMLRKPETARQGRVTLFVFALSVTALLAVVWWTLFAWLGRLHG